MKNKKQLFSLLLLVSCSLVQQTVFAAAAASANPPGKPKIDGSQGEIVPGDKLQKDSPEYKKVYGYKIGNTRNKVGLDFGEIIIGLRTAMEHGNVLLYNALIELTRESIYNGLVPVEVAREFKRLEVSGEIPLNLGAERNRGNENFSADEKKDILWPLLVWAIEQNDLSLTEELWQILGDKPKPCHYTWVCPENFEEADSETSKK
jgi:hypothetical protein